MHVSHATLFIYWVSLFVGYTKGQSSSITFCNRLYHSVTVANDKLYVDGGEVRTVADGNVSVSLPEYVSTLDLSKPFSNSDPSIWQSIPKNVTSPNNNPPTLNDGSMFATKSGLFLFGGALSAAPGAPAVPPPNALWQYDFSNDNWTSITPSGDPVQRIHWGTSVQAVNSSNGYFLGGAITPKSDPAFNALSGAEPYQVQGLITLNEDTVHYTNSSTTGLNLDGTTLGGFLTLIESLGSAGVLISFGGISNNPGKPMELDDADLEDPTMHRSLGNVSVYDIGGDKWFQQTASGDIPQWRYVGCSVAVSAPDGSSHSIYVFGGWGNSAGVSDGNVYVLSIPSFRWIRVNEDSNLRSRHQCALASKSTMLVVGGIHSRGDSLQPLDATGCDTTQMFAQGLGIFSLNNHQWSTKYDPAQASQPYQVHPNISKVIGGNQQGSATLQAPAGGFSQRALATLLKARGTTNHEHLRTAVIAGIAVATGVVTIVALLLTLYLIRRRNRLQAPPRPQISSPMPLYRKASELTASSFGSANSPLSLQRGPVELSDGKGAAYEISSAEKPLPPYPHDSTTISIQEMEGELGWHPAMRSAMEDEKRCK
ncbi:hypothetical protein ACLMJK_004017 [Lecanora helva]